MTGAPPRASFELMIVIALNRKVMGSRRDQWTQGTVRRLSSLLGLAVACLVSACGETNTSVTTQPIEPPVLATLDTPRIVRVDTVLRGLEVPWGIARRADGGLYVAERPGRIQYLAAGSDTAVLWATLDVYANEPGIGPEAGLMGLALDPDSSRGDVLYALATTWRRDGDREWNVPARLWRRAAAIFSATGALRYKNQVLRLSRAADGSLQREVLVDNLPTNHYHAGGSIAVGPDGHLYVSVGDATLPQLARDSDVLVGKLLRYTRDGRIPDDNPVPGSPVWASGLRNTQAFVWLEDAALVGVEHGPTGMTQEVGRAGQDELNVIERGGDLGWPDVIGWASADGIAAPIWVWETAIAPAGLTRLVGAGSDSTAQVLVGALRGHLELIQLARRDGRWIPTHRATFANQRFGRIRTLLAETDSTVLLTTSNRDARGAARSGDDLLLRLTLGR